MDEMQRIDDFFSLQADAHLQVFPVVPRGTVIGFLGTTATGAAPTIGVNRIVEVQEAEKGVGVTLVLDGGIPRTPVRGECVAACLVDLARYRGYQVKTGVADDGPIADAKGGKTTLVCKSVYTVHHSPNVLNVFERVPFAELRKDLAATDHAAVVIGQRANVSPRFIFHRERSGDVLRLFHGDGLVHKTYLNLQKNLSVAYLVCDLKTHRGFALTGTCEECAPDASGEGPARVRTGFAALGFELTRTFVTSISEVTPVQP